MSATDRIAIDPAICHGKPCIRGLLNSRCSVPADVLVFRANSRMKTLPRLQQQQLQYPQAV